MLDRRSFLRGLFTGAVAAVVAPYVPKVTYSFLGGILRAPVTEELIAEGWYRRAVSWCGSCPTVVLQTPVKVFKRSDGEFRWDSVISVDPGKFTLRDFHVVGSTVETARPRFVRDDGAAYESTLEEMLLTPIPQRGSYHVPLEMRGGPKSYTHAEIC